LERTLYEWAAEAAMALELMERAPWAGNRETVSWVLDLARDLAHGAMRPAAPVGAFLAGVAIGLEGGERRDTLERVRAVLEGTLNPP
jgi:cell division inhibitor SulA